MKIFHSTAEIRTSSKICEHYLEDVINFCVLGVAGEKDKNSDILEVEQVHTLLDKIEIPSGEEEIVFIETNVTECGIITSPTPRQQLYLAQEINKDVFGRGSKEKYTLLSTQRSFEIAAGKKPFGNHTSENLYEILGKVGVYNREVILDSGYIIPDPEIIVKNGEFKSYKGETVPAEINIRNAYETLKRAGLINEEKLYCEKFPIVFSEGESCVYTKYPFGLNFRIRTCPSWSKYLPNEIVFEKIKN